MTAVDHLVAEVPSDASIDLSIVSSRFPPGSPKSWIQRFPPELYGATRSSARGRHYVWCLHFLRSEAFLAERLFRGTETRRLNIATMRIKLVDSTAFLCDDWRYGPVS